ncbi:energy transducer TonB [Sphingomonas sp. GlSt437]|uniref:energy transducer TonB n=1 Tax=Sphingomonas sp. GlSt437 TaxID=3389970 RepID=UPI003A836509
MAYADRNNSGSRLVAIIIVAILQGALAYAFITGLAQNFVKKAQEKLNTFDVAPPPPPPPDQPPPPPPPDQPLQPPPVVTPPAAVVIQQQSPVVINTTPIAPPAYTPAPPAPPAPPPAPPAPHLAKGAQAKGSYQDWFSQDYYPPAAKKASIEGRVGVLLSIGADGRVSGCRVVSSSGNQDLDDTTCRLAQRFGRFRPAQDDAGNPIASELRLPPVRWQLKDE